MKRGEKGFTLLELLIGLAITGIIMVPLMMTTVTLLTNPERSTDHNIALQQVQNAGYWISRDAQMAHNVSFNSTSGFPLTLNIRVDANEANDFRIEYLFDGNRLKRQLYDSSDNLTAEAFIAEHIDTDYSTFSTLASNLSKLTVRAAKGETVVTTSYEINHRLIVGE